MTIGILIYAGSWHEILKNKPNPKSAERSTHVQK
jgi:hypothetical protein